LAAAARWTRSSASHATEAVGARAAVLTATHQLVHTLVHRLKNMEKMLDGMGNGKFPGADGAAPDDDAGGVRDSSELDADDVDSEDKMEL
jgi:hypothetical protein